MLNDVRTKALNEKIMNNAPYTIEEIDSRLELSEDDFRMGRTCSNAEVMSELRTFIDLL